MARTADDCALMLSVMAGDDVEDLCSMCDGRLSAVPEVDLSTLRVAISVDFGYTCRAWNPRYLRGTPQAVPVRLQPKRFDPLLALH